MPNNWDKYGFLSLKPLNKWIDDFKTKIEFFRTWLNKSILGHELNGYLITAFFLPAGFLTAIL